MQTFTYTQPDSTREAVQAMTRFSDHKSRFLSSGTTLADPIKPDVKRPERGVIVGALAIAIFVFDSATRLEVTAGVLYVVVVLMAVRICRPRGVAIVAAGDKPRSSARQSLGKRCSSQPLVRCLGDRRYNFCRFENPSGTDGDTEGEIGARRESGDSCGTNSLDRP